MSFFGTHGGFAVIYKPAAGSRPLPDFDAATLPHREVAAFELSRAAGWNCVPHTELVDGPHGVGSAQRWCGPTGEYVQATGVADLSDFSSIAPDDGAGVVGLFTHVPDEFEPIVVLGQDEDDHDVVVAHSRSEAVRALALFDVVCNQTDRKASHIISGPGGAPYAIDNGLTFHVENKLRTVLWGFAGEALTDAERDLLRRSAAVLSGDSASVVGRFLSDAERAAALTRTEQLLTRGVFPTPYGDCSDLPWPPW